MSADVVDFTGITCLDIDPARILERIPRDLQRVTIIGLDATGEEYFASSAADGGTVLWDMERAKLKLLRIGEDDNAS